MRLPRMTTRRLIIAVLIVAAVLGPSREAARLVWLRRYYLGQAARWARDEAIAREVEYRLRRSFGPRGPGAGPTRPGTEGSDARLQQARARVEALARQRQAMEHLARRPWQPAPDRPPLGDTAVGDGSSMRSTRPRPPATPIRPDRIERLE